MSCLLAHNYQSQKACFLVPVQIILCSLQAGVGNVLCKTYQFQRLVGDLIATQRITYNFIRRIY